MSRSSARSLRDGEVWRGRDRASCALAGFGFSAWLTYVEVVRLDAICIWCVGSAICMTVLAVLAVVRVLSAPPPARGREREDGRGGRAADPVGPAVRPGRGVHQPAADGLVDRPGQRVARGGAEPRVERVERGGAAAQRAQDLVWVGRRHCPV